MTIITLFEYGSKPYSEIPRDTLVALKRLNDSLPEKPLVFEFDALRATQFVGVLRVGDTTIQLLPKVDRWAADDQVSGATRNLLYLLSYALNMRISEPEIAALQRSTSDWFELLTALFASSLHRAMKVGIHQEYVRLEERLPVIRGRWDISRQLSRQPHVHHKFDLVYDEFSPDNPLNRIFRYVVERLVLQTRIQQNRRWLLDIRQWLSQTELLNTIPSNSLKSVQFSRLNDRFEPAFNLARLFVEHSSPQLLAGKQDAFAFIFDMNKLFEQFVYGFISRHSAEILPPGWYPRSQVNETYLALKRVSSLPPQQVFKLRPDIVIEHGIKSGTLIADTKYKMLDETERNIGVAQGDMYQMLAYMVRYGCSNIVLIYPRSEGAPQATVQFEIDTRRIHVITIDIRQYLYNRQSEATLINDLHMGLSPLLQ